MNCKVLKMTCAMILALLFASAINIYSGDGIFSESYATISETEYWACPGKAYKVTIQYDETVTGVTYSFSGCDSLKSTRISHSKGKDVYSITINNEGTYYLKANGGSPFVLDYNLVAHIGHDFNDYYTIDKQATCITTGKRSIHCSRCTASKEAEVLPMIDHQWGNSYTTDKAATCLENGSESIHCVSCGTIKPNSSRTIISTGHKYGEWVITDNTCTQQGKKEKKCTVCGDVITEYLPATGHVWEKKYTYDKAPTCEQNGTESIHCSICGESKENTIRTVEKTGHSYSEWSIVKKATCTTAGTMERICSNCQKKETKVIPATDHEYGEWIILKEPTCTEKGSKRQNCLNCPSYVLSEILPTGHIWNVKYTVDKPATKDAIGYESIHCSVCDAIKPDTCRAIPKETEEMEYSVELDPAELLLMKDNTTGAKVSLVGNFTASSVKNIVCASSNASVAYAKWNAGQKFIKVYTKKAGASTITFRIYLISPSGKESMITKECKVASLKKKLTFPDQNLILSVDEAAYGYNIPKELPKNFVAKWTSSDSSIASVDNNGCVTPINTGTCKITASVGGKKYSYKVTVLWRPNYAAKIVKIDKKRQIVTVKFANFGKKPITIKTKGTTIWYNYDKNYRQLKASSIRIAPEKMKTLKFKVKGEKLDPKIKAPEVSYKIRYAGKTYYAWAYKKWIDSTYRHSKDIFLYTFYMNKEE